MKTPENPTLFIDLRGVSSRNNATLWNPRDHDPSFLTRPLNQKSWFSDLIFIFSTRRTLRKTSGRIATFGDGFATEKRRIFSLIFSGHQIQIQGCQTRIRIAPSFKFFFDAFSFSHAWRGVHTRVHSSSWHARVRKGVGGLERESQCTWFTWVQPWVSPMS